MIWHPSVGATDSVDQSLLPVNVLHAHRSVNGSLLSARLIRTAWCSYRVGAPSFRNFSLALSRLP
jgi:hypothetical protein